MTDNSDHLVFTESKERPEGCSDFHWAVQKSIEKQLIPRLAWKGCRSDLEWTYDTEDNTGAHNLADMNPVFNATLDTNDGYVYVEHYNDFAIVSDCSYGKVAQYNYADVDFFKLILATLFSEVNKRRWPDL